jgi:uncharacterized protein with FMN-binding domain
MRRALAALVVTVVAVILLAGYETRPPRTVNPHSPLYTAAKARAAQPPRAVPRGKTAAGAPITTPYSIIQVQATVDKGRLTGVKTLLLSGDGPHTNALNRRAEPILRAEALKAGSAKIDSVSGATGTSESWRASLQAAIDKARGLPD